MTFKLPVQKVDKVTLVEIYCPHPNKDEQVKFLNIWQKWIVEVDSDINLSGGIYNTLDYGMYIYARGFCYKDEAQTNKLLSPFYNLEGVQISTENMQRIE